MKGLNHDLVDGSFDRLELALQFTVLGGGDARGDDRSGDIASPPQGSLGFDENIRNVLLNASGCQDQIISRLDEMDYLLFAKQGKVQENFKRLCVGGENDEFGDTAVQGLRG